MKSDSGGPNIGRLWKLRKNLWPFETNPPPAMIDYQGNIVTSATNLKKLTLDHHKKVQRNRIINPEQSKPWNMEDLKNVLSHLKKGKSRDP